MKAAVPYLLSAGNGGSIITISPVGELKALPGASHYSIAKHAVTGLTKSAAIELGAKQHPSQFDPPVGSRNRDG